MIITVTDQSAAVTTPDRLVSHSASVYTATFVLDSTWDSLTKMVVFKAGEKSKAFGTPTIEKGMTGTSVIVPWEPLAVYGRELWVGIYGTDSTGLVKPTTWADAGTILQGVDIDADNAQEPTEGPYQKWVDEVSGYATTASTAATSAKASADSAAASVTQSGTSVTDAAASATAAKASETAAATSASNASASATAAKTSETNAKSSETAAKTSETNAASSASSASTSAGTATTAASGASTSETNAKASETAAASSASAASTSAANAKTSETNAASSASSASSSASSASTSATNAASSATAAQTAAASIDMTNYYNKTETNNLLSAKAAETEVTAVTQSLSSHTSDTTVHVTAEERTAWNNKAPRPTQTAVTLSAASWVGTSAPYTYTISSVTCTATQIVSVYGAMGLTTEQVKAMAKSMITGSSQAVNSIVLEAQSLPTIDLPVIVEVGGEPA